jgi:hypothetical protein
MQERFLFNMFVLPIIVALVTLTPLVLSVIMLIRKKYQWAIIFFTTSILLYAISHWNTIFDLILRLTARGAGH